MTRKAKAERIQREKDELLENYFYATRTLDKMIPHISGFVKSFAPQVVSVNVGSSTRTEYHGDNKYHVYIQPFLDLITPRNHRRVFCDVVDESGSYKCKACESEERIYFCIFHELAHILYNSFDKIDLRKTHIGCRVGAFQYGNDEYANFISKKVKESKTSPIKNYDAFIVAGKLHANITFMLKAFEDIRIENAIAEHRQGFMRMSRNFWKRSLANGVYLEEGEVKYFSDYPVDVQIVFASIVASKDISLEEFDDKVIDAVNLAKNVGLLDTSKIKSIADSAIRSTELVGFYHKLGFFSDMVPPEEPEDESGGDDSSESGGQTKGDSGDENNDTEQSANDGASGDTSMVPEKKVDGAELNPGSDNDSSDADDSDDINNKSGSDSSRNSGDNYTTVDNDSGSNKDVSSDVKPADRGEDKEQDKRDIPSTRGDLDYSDIYDIIEKALHGEIKNTTEDDVKETDLDVAISQYAAFDSPVKEVSYQSILDRSEFESLRGSNFTGRSKKSTVPRTAKVMGSKIRARKIFSESKLDKIETDLKSGRLNTRALGTRAWADDERLFRKRHLPDGVEWDICIGMDLSRSTEMLGSGSYEKIREITYLTCMLLDSVNVSFSVYGHSTDSGYGLGVLDNSYIHTLWRFKSKKERFSAEVKKAILKSPVLAGSLDGINLEFYRKQVQSSPANRKMVIYFTDGKIPDTSREIQTPIVQREIKNYQKAGIPLIVIAVDTDTKLKAVGVDTILVTDSTDIKTVLNEIEKRIVPVG